MDYQEAKAILEESEANAAKQSLREQAERQQAISEEVERNAIWDKIANANMSGYQYGDFKQSLTESFLTEALVVFTDNCLNPELIRNENCLALIRQLVTNYVNENGSMMTLMKMKRTSNLLSEMAYIVETTVSSVLEGVDKNNPETFKIDKGSKDKFYKGLEKVDADEAIGKITERVRSQTADFVNANMKEKADLTAALGKTEKKISDVKADLDQKAQTKKNAEEAQKMQEGYAAIGKRRITDIQASRSRNILEQMVHNLSKSALTNEDAKKVFVEDSQLNMDKIVERCETLCTFITAFDSIKLIDINEEYIGDLLDSLKK